MKKSFFKIILFTFVTVLPVFAGEAKYTRDYETLGFPFRLYENSDYLTGNYRSNFVSIPQSRMLNHKDGFRWKVGVFELDGNTLYVGYSEAGSGALQLFDENGKMWISKESYKEREESYFKYDDLIPGGVVTQIELKGKKYTVAIAGISSNKAGIYSDSEGFRMWVENKAPKDTAASKTIEKTLCYDAADICEGIFKLGYTRLWGEVIESPENEGFIYKYSYKGFDFLFNGNTNDGSEFLRNTDGTKLPADFVSAFYMYITLSGGKISERVGVGVEADVQLGDNKVRLAFCQYDGNKRVWVKDTSGYPVIQQKNTNQAKAKKSSKAKSSGKAAKFTKDYENWRRVYSKSDILKGLYKSNYKYIPQNNTKEYIVAKTIQGAEEEAQVKAALYNYKDYSFTLSYNPVIRWNLFTENNLGLVINRTSTIHVENSEYDGIEAELILNGKTVVEKLAIIPVDIEKGDYRLFVKTGPDEELATNYTDSFGIEYYDCVDVHSGVYKPGFEFLENYYYLEGDKANALYPDLASTENDRVYDIVYKDFNFFVGPAQDPMNYVKDSEGNVIFNPETQIRYITYDENKKPSYEPWQSYGWEGKVKLGDKEVILAVFKWNHAVAVYVKEL
ncbi:MAG: hypothetical protein MR424_10950 [Treponema sp.]|nr:hypothetical protein [Treponema sp.]